jgi:hypothetical protein
VRTRADQTGPELAAIIDEMDPVVAEVLGAGGEGSPLHVLTVGTFSVNAAVGQLGRDVAVFHCVEWFQTPQGERALVAHETAHAYHRLVLGAAGQVPGDDDDLAWMLFSEGLATQVSRRADPNGAETDYFWYGLPKMDGWVTWCAENAEDLEKLAREALDDPKAVESFFGGGTVEGRWRTGHHLADRLVAGLGRALPELARLSVDDARRAIRDALTHR